MKGARLVKEDAASVAAPAAPVAAGNRISVETAMAVAAFIDTRQGKETDMLPAQSALVAHVKQSGGNRPLRPADDARNESLRLAIDIQRPDQFAVILGKWPADAVLFGHCRIPAGRVHTAAHSTPAIRSNTAPSAICDQTKAARVRAMFIWTAPRLRTVPV